MKHYPTMYLLLIPTPIRGKVGYNPPFTRKIIFNVTTSARFLPQKWGTINRTPFFRAGQCTSHRTGFIHTTEIYRQQKTLSCRLEETRTNATQGPVVGLYLKLYYELVKCTSAGDLPIFARP